MSDSYKKIEGGRRHHTGDDVVDERKLYRRSDRRSSARKSEKDRFAVWSDMNPKRPIRRNDGWQQGVYDDLI